MQPATLGLALLWSIDIQAGQPSCFLIKKNSDDCSS